MHVTVKNVVQVMEQIAPVSLAESWDNVGLLVGRESQPVKKLLLALDLTKESAEQALKQGVDMIITHHPVIFTKINTLVETKWQQELLLSMIENKIAVYCGHTNYDCAELGVNHVLAAKLGSKNLEVFDEASGLGRIGQVEPCTLEEFAQFVKEQLQCNYVTFADGGKEVCRVAVGGGACSDFISLALAKGCDTFVTGDVKYHAAQEAAFSGLNIIDAGHQSTERPAMVALADYLSDYFPKEELELLVAKEGLLLQVK